MGDLPTISNPISRKLAFVFLFAVSSKEAKGFQTYLAASLINAEIKSESELFLGYHDIQTVDKDRLKSFVDRMIHCAALMPGGLLNNYTVMVNVSQTVLPNDYTYHSTDPK